MSRGWKLQGQVGKGSRGKEKGGKEGRRVCASVLSNTLVFKGGKEKNNSSRLE